MAPLAKADGGLIFADLPQVPTLARSIRHLNEGDPRVARELLEAIVNSAAPREDRLKLLKNVKTGANKITDLALKVPKDAPKLTPGECLGKLARP